MFSAIWPVVWTLCWAVASVAAVLATRSRPDDGDAARSARPRPAGTVSRRSRPARERR